MNKWFENTENKKMGLVLGGGGARGCYEVGVWQALKQENIQFDCVAGTSIGAIISAFYASGNLEGTEEFICHLKPAKIAKDLFAFPASFEALLKERKTIARFMEKYLLSSQGMDISPLRDAIHRLFDYGSFTASPVNFACMTFNVTKMGPEAYFKEQMTVLNAVDILLASASCFPAFPMLKMNGCDYIDGGYWSNVPISLAMEMGAEKILAVDVEGPGITRPIPKGADVMLIKPILPLQNFLDFSNEQAVRAMKIGYLETSKFLGRYAGALFTFVREAVRNMALMDEYLSFMFFIHRIQVDEKTKNDILQRICGFSSSSLSERLDTVHYGYGQLVEALAYLAGVEPVMLYKYEDFVEALFKKLNAIPVSGFSTDIEAALEHLKELTEEGIIAWLHRGLQASGGEVTEVLRVAAGFFPSEFCLACVWYYLECAWTRAFGKKKT
ncbi:MAG: patatin-like phospholipase family protein [Erysipelotrichaceae bacterium]|nr:patatin-like phospholipase family protein [Erysipelotrichaceae bacterium]